MEFLVGTTEARHESDEKWNHRPRFIDNNLLHARINCLSLLRNEVLATHTHFFLGLQSRLCG